MAHFFPDREKEEETKSVSESDSYGFEFASYKNGNLYYAWVLYVLPGSPAAEADWNGGTGLLLLVVRLRM